MKVKEAVRILEKALSKDKDFKKSWQSTIACCFMDAVKQYKSLHKKQNLTNQDLNIIANYGADIFLTLLTEKLER